MSTVKATNFQNASSATANMVTDASGNVSFGGTAAMSRVQSMVSRGQHTTTR